MSPIESQRGVAVAGGVRRRAGNERRLAVVLPAALIALVGCGKSETPTGGARPRPTAPAGVVSTRHAPPVVRNGGLAGRLVVTPASPMAGDEIQLAVENVGRMTIYYGLRNRVQRHVPGRWEAATSDVYGTPHPGVRLVLLIARPGQRSEPSGDRIQLPRSLRPGTYRVLTGVTGKDPGISGTDRASPRVTLKATFVVRRALTDPGPRLVAAVELALRRNPNREASNARCRTETQEEVRRSPFGNTSAPVLRCAITLRGELPPAENYDVQVLGNCFVGERVRPGRADYGCGALQR